MALTFAIPLNIYDGSFFFFAKLPSLYGLNQVTNYLTE